MTKRIVKSDRSQEPEVVKVITPDVKPIPEPEPETIDVLEFSKVGDTTEGMFNSTDENGHNFTANGKKFIIEKNDENQTINEALAIVPNGALIRIEYLGFEEKENRGLFEVSTID